eukprot:TRINITY_DN23201_c0_g1_i1.p1 TRINITY_DN23201_c0_g1~~TRINITY_DN23201_c0_g1_i1.p1  ORF type:complete len:253 (+),score=45.47 TRINITY_DN23201_c0_g1_i1:101-760(+)
MMASLPGGAGTALGAAVVATAVGWCILEQRRAPKRRRRRNLGSPSRTAPGSPGSLRRRQLPASPPRTPVPEEDGTAEAGAAPRPFDPSPVRARGTDGAQPPGSGAAAAAPGAVASEFQFGAVMRQSPTRRRKDSDFNNYLGRFLDKREDSGVLLGAARNDPSIAVDRTTQGGGGAVASRMGPAPADPLHGRQFGASVRESTPPEGILYRWLPGTPRKQT